MKIFKTNMQWVYDTKELSNTYLAYSICPDARVMEFIQGMASATFKIKMGVIRSLIAENLDSIARGFNLKVFQHHVIKTQREERLSYLVGINLKSFDKLTMQAAELGSGLESIKTLRRKFQNISLRDIESITGIPKSTIEDWLSVKSEKADAGG
jgi:hypothetical protein